MWTTDADDRWPVETPPRLIETVDSVILLGPDGAVYCISERKLAGHRVADDVAASLRKAYLDDAEEPGGDGRPDAFRILARGPVAYERAVPRPRSRQD